MNSSVGSFASILLLTLVLNRLLALMADFRGSTLSASGDSFLLYILVDEFESYLRRIPELEGSSKGEVEVVPGNAEYVRFYDPDGNRLALWRTAGQEESKRT